MIKRITFLTVFVLALLGLDLRSGSQYAAQPQAQGPEYVPDEIIVKFREGVDESQKDLARFRVFGTRKKAFKVIRGLEVVKLFPRVSVEDAIDLLRQDPDVLYAEPNYILRTTLIPNDTRFGEMWGLNNVGQSRGTPDADIDAPEAWSITTGSSNVVVAILDTGIDYNHQDLSANMFRNTADCNNNGVDDDGNGFIDDCYGIDVANSDSDPMDDNDHGTHVGGTIGAVGNNNVGVVGVNWNVRLMSCKFFDASGQGTTEGAITCLDYVKTMKDRGVNIVATSNSWGGGDFSQALIDAIDAQWRSDILFITAAGNGNFFGVGQNNDATPFYPCDTYLPNVICVAATDRTDARASFSNYGRHTVHIGAPGVDILSTLPGNNYAAESGTSMATPHVSGVAALLKAQDPTRDWRAIKNLILTGGNTISSMANTITGKRLNANGAMNCSNSVVQSRLIPIANTISASPGVPVDLGYLNIKCAIPNGSVTVSVSPGGETVTLLDDGLDSDQAAGDGIYSGQWTPSATGKYTLTFPGNDKVTVNVANPTISVTPSSIDFGGTAVGSSKDKTFTVTNSGGGILSGNATTNAPYSIFSGGTYKLSAGQSQTVTVRFAPTSVGTFAGNVTFTGGAGSSATVSGIGVKPANIALNYNGKLRDRVGQSETALTADGSLDGTFTVTLQAGSGNRTVTSLDLRRSVNTGIWDTIPNNGYWVSGAASSLDAPLLNASNGTVNFAVADGGTFNIFASDQNDALYSPGSLFILKATFADGSTASANVSLPPPPSPANIALTFNGKLRDRVGQGDLALGPDNSLDGTFTVTLLSGSGSRTVTRLDLSRSGGGNWDTVPANGYYWALGAANSLDGPLYNSADTRVNFAVADGGTFNIFASDQNGALYGPGSGFILKVTFADGSITSASTTVPTPPPANIALNYIGKRRD